MNLIEVQTKLYESLKESGWAKLFRSFLLSNDFLSILQKLADFSAKGKNFTPTMKQLFTAFYECPVDKVKVIIVSQDVYTQQGVADGIPFSCSNTMHRNAPLRNLQRAIAKTVYNDMEKYEKMSPDLRYLSKQGVLFVNTTLTTEINKIDKHVELWKPFTGFMIDMLSQLDDVVWVFLGEKTWRYTSSIEGDCLVVSDPALSIYTRSNLWNCEDVFNRVNEWLENHGQTKIEW